MVEWKYDDLLEWILSGCDNKIALKVIILDIRKSNITVLPKEIGKLINLNNFYCSNNQLTELIPEIGNLHYLGRLSKERLMEEYYTANIGLTQHTNGATQSVTYKLFDLLSCSLPIINSLESEMRDIIVDYKVGFHHPSGDAKALANFILLLKQNTELYNEMRHNAKNLFLTKGDSKKVYAQFLDFIEVQTNS